MSDQHSTQLAPATLSEAALDLLGSLRQCATCGVEAPAALDDALVWIAEPDAHWLQHRPAATEIFTGTREVLPEVRVAVLGGHFPGNCVVHWDGRDGAGVLLSGDTIAPHPDRRTVAFMRSFPNRIPLSGAVALRVAEAAAAHPFARVSGNFENVVPRDARQTVRDSARRHAAWTDGEHDDLT